MKTEIDNWSQSPIEEILDDAEAFGMYNHPFHFALGGTVIGVLAANAITYLVDPGLYSPEVARKVSETGAFIGALTGSTLSYITGMFSV